LQQPWWDLRKGLREYLGFQKSESEKWCFVKNRMKPATLHSHESPKTIALCDVVPYVINLATLVGDWLVNKQLL
jgi:hypothetical protein